MSQETANSLPEDSSPILEKLLPSAVLGLLAGLPGAKWYRSQTEERRDLLVVVALAALVFVPWLGAVGLWDPWEPHYGEVAREMIHRSDYVFPWWQSASFFSKPPLLMWLISVGMNIVGVDRVADNQPLPLYTEWAMRLPVAMLATAGVLVLTLAIRRVFGRRQALLTAFVLVTCPFYFFLARQVMEDMPLVACLEIALGSFVLAEFAPQPEGKKGNFWWYVMYAFAGFAALAKESLGIAIPGLVVLTYLVLSGDWGLLRRARLLPGLVLFLLIAGPWYASVSLSNGRDDEQFTFLQRLAHDNTQRFFTSSVHTTTPAWTFTYFIEQLGWGLFPWVALIPGAIVAMGKLDRSKTDRQERAALFFAGWAVAVFGLFTASGTKFHHYIFPAVPALAFWVARYIDQLWREGLDRNVGTLLAGAFTVALVAAGLYSWHDDSGVHSGLKHFTDLFVYQYGRPYPFGVDEPDLFRNLCMAGIGLSVAAALSRNKSLTFTAFGGFALVMSLWGSWFFWRWMSHHWAQRDEFWAYYKERQPNEPITGFILGAGWRGETFYGRNTIKEINDPNKLKEFLDQPGPEFVIVEQARYNNLRSVAAGRYRLRIVDQSSNKFYLVEVD